MTSPSNCDKSARWAALECILGRKGPMQRSQFEPSSELVQMIARDVRVLVVGAGGLGCELLKSLSLMGFGNLDVIDMDTIDISNLNRQFLFSVRDIGRPKAEVAAEFIMKRVETCTVTPHFKRLEDFDESFYRQFDIVVCGLDSVIARRWINSMLASLVRYNEDGTPDPYSVIPLVDGGTEGFKGHIIVVLFGITGCVECSLDLYPPQVNYPLCTIAHTPRLPEHCVEYVRLLLWPEQQPFGEGVAIDADIPEHLAWVYERCLERAKQFGIEGVTLRLVKGVIKRIIPAVASTNAVIAAALATEVFKLVTLCYDYLKNYMNFSDLEGIYTYTFPIERKADCIVCNNVPKNIFFAPTDTLADVIEYLKTSSELQMHSPSITTVVDGSNRSLYLDFADAAKTLKPNLKKQLSELGLTDGQMLNVSDVTTPRVLAFRLCLSKSGAAC
uniref:NEDD8-activating enzyme E1 catalytic subunit n=1 Tax=Schistocephalus solidus TaxID=70667 RepID=A0A0V0JBF0_SCHSO